MPVSPPRLLIVEDDARIRTDLMDSLRGEGLEVEVATSYAMAEDALVHHYDLVLLDLVLPDGDGIELCRELRRSGRSVPIMVVSGRDEPEQRVLGLDAGADDYVVKPFYLPEVVARVQSLLRRVGKTPRGGFIRHMDLWVDLDRVIAGNGDRRFRLKPREFDLLTFMVRNPGKAWTRAELLDQVWGHDYKGDERTVDLHVRRLRAKIQDAGGSPRCIETVWGIGYRMSEESGGSSMTQSAGGVA